ncbi:MAG TPA: hypothetical protein VMV94_11615 [Phycisphaerae bacterium]|nr:hypothetical protein [Phycisphaerae bacterium]
MQNDSPSTSSLSPTPFDILAFSHLTPAQVRTAFEPTPRPSTPQLDELIAAEWERQTALARQAGRVLFNGGLLRYVRHAVLKGSTGGTEAIELTIGPTCYRDFVGTNLFNHHRLEEFGWERFSNPVGTTATLVSREGLICYGRRSESVAYHASHVHTFGGALEERDRAADGRIDPFAAVCREVEEELGLRRDELADLCCVGLIRDKEICQPEMLFEARLDMTADELRARWRSAEAADEHVDIVTLPDRPDAIVPFIRGCGPIAPVAIGALFLHGRRVWGEEWFRAAIESG